MKLLVSRILTFSVALAFSAFLFIGPVFGATSLDLVTERITGDYAAIDEFMTDTEDPGITKEQYIKEIEELELRLIESEELYKEYSITNENEKKIEPEIRQITNALIKTRQGVQTMKAGLMTEDNGKINQAVDLLNASDSEISTASVQLQVKMSELENQGKQTESWYIVASVIAVAISTGLYFAKSGIDQEKYAYHYEALNRLFLQSLVPLAGIAITLGTLEYAKITQSSSYTVMTGLMAVGALYFIGEVLRYLFVVRPRISGMNDVGMTG